MMVDEKSSLILRQYELTIRDYYKLRGAGYVRTEEGLFLLRQRQTKEERVAWEEECKRQLADAGSCPVDLAIKNRDGLYVTEGDYGETYLVRHWQDGADLDLLERGQCIAAAGALGTLHASLRQLPVKTEYIAEPVGATFDRRIRELRRLSTYLYRRKRKNAFELVLYETLPRYLTKCEEAREWLQRSGWEQLWDEAVQAGIGVHGNYGSHSVLLLGGQAFYHSFEKLAIGPQVLDLYYLLRKSMEKQQWSRELFAQMLTAYERQQPLSKLSRAVLCCQFLFPEKYYRVCNRYFNMKKSWIPGRTEQKLGVVIASEAAREQFEAWLQEDFSSCFS